MMSKLKVYDMHTHLLTRETMPLDVVFGRFDLSRSQLRILIAAANDGIEYIDDLVDLFNWMTDKNYNVKPLLESLAKTPDQYVKDFQIEMDKAGVDRAVLLDLPTNKNWEPFKDLLDSMISFVGLSQENLSCPCSCTVDGIKLYPAMTGGVVEDYRKIFIFAEKHGISITIHCSRGGIGEFKYLSHPPNWAQFIYEYDVNVCFAHGGGTSFQWINDIKKIALESDCDNVYIDTAFHDMAVRNPDVYFNMLRPVIESNINVMFGSDWPLCGIYYSYKDLVDTYKNNLEPWQWEQISNTNPRSFLREQ